ncbi:hypothetical protein ACS04_28605 [Streptomyces roseus]|uniref:Uncharacterized protein n=1 Tax=Streptomyces roseus TaxID=66430 RepID=A0A0J6XF44_9ACTN|nr:hypothetical protein ACS04_28605 [Streptomyces roseus]
MGKCRCYSDGSGIIMYTLAGDADHPAYGGRAGTVFAALGDANGNGVGSGAKLRWCVGPGRDRSTEGGPTCPL